MASEVLELTLNPSSDNGRAGYYIGEDSGFTGFPPTFDTQNINGATVFIGKAYGIASSIWTSRLSVGYANFSLTDEDIDPANVEVLSVTLRANIEINFGSGSGTEGPDQPAWAFVSRITTMAAEWLDNPETPLPVTTLYQPDDTTKDAISEIDLESFYEDGTWLDGLNIHNAQLSESLEVELDNFAAHVTNDVFGLRFALVGTPDSFDPPGEFTSLVADNTSVTLTSVRLVIEYREVAVVEALPIVDVEAHFPFGDEISGRLSVDPGPPVFHKAKLRRGY